MNFQRISKNKIGRIINHLTKTGAKVMIVICDYPNFYIDVKWPTGRHWQITGIE